MGGSSRVFNVGVALFALSLAALGALEAWRGAAPPGLHAFPETTPEIAVRSAGVLVLVSSLAMLAGPFVRWASSASASLWAVFGVLAAVSAAATPTDGTAWVPVLETATFAAIAWARPGQARALARIVFGLMLICFGAVHLTHRDLIASLIPDWIPFVAHWPWLTGAVNVAAGLACVAGRGARLGAFAVALMFGAWLPLVHAPRIAEAPESLFEWSFALTALALVGAALQVASGFAGMPARR